MHRQRFRQVKAGRPGRLAAIDDHLWPCVLTRSVRTASSSRVHLDNRPRTVGDRISVYRLATWSSFLPSSNEAALHAQPSDCLGLSGRLTDCLPRRPQSLVRIENDPVLLRSPPALAERGIQGMKPTLSAVYHCVNSYVDTKKPWMPTYLCLSAQASGWIFPSTCSLRVGLACTRGWKSGP